MRANVRCFSKIGRALIECCVQVVGFHADPMRDAIMKVAGVDVRPRGKIACKRVDPRARTDAVLVAI